MSYDKKYENDLLDMASKLDAVTSSRGEISRLADAIVHQRDDSATVELCRKISEISTGAGGDQNKIRLAKQLKDTIVSYHGYIRVHELCKAESKKTSEPEKSLEELKQELDSLVGLNEVKNTVNDLIAYHKVQELRKQKNLFSEKNTLHLAFTGNPGTGKTTVARIIGRIYKQIGLLSKGQFIEVSRTDLIAGYQGQTALKVKKVIEKAMGGVLFIDEAYSITENDHADSYGRECLTELTKALEDYRDDLVVIVAGYTEPMQLFFESNPGLRSRFNTFIKFDDYDEEELINIMKQTCEKNNYETSADANEKIKNVIHERVTRKEEEFANGRFIRNLFEDMIMNHARRVDHLENPNEQDLKTIKGEDVPGNDCVV